MMENDLRRLVKDKKLSQEEAESLSRAFEESKAADAVLLKTIRTSRTRRRITALGTTISVLLVVLSLGFLFFAAITDISFSGDPPIMVDTQLVQEAGPELEALIASLEQKLRRPGRAADYQRLADAYRKRFSTTGNQEDLVQANQAYERAMVLMKKNPSEVTMKMNTILFTLVFAVLVVGVIGLAIMFLYNGLVKRDENVDARWAQVETVLQRRLDLIPQLVETVKGYAEHESETLLQVTEARSKLSDVLKQTGGKAPTEKAVISQLDAASSNLGTALGRLMMLVEQYPDLKANQNFLSLQDQLEGTENRIAVERQRYNDAVRNLNTRLRSFPHNVFSGTFGFEAREYFQSKVGAEEAVQVSF